MELTDSHIDYIIKDLTYRGLIVDGIQSEIVDHICSRVESEMKNGIRFIDAYQNALQSFGNTSGILETQKQTWKAHHQTPNMMFRNYITIAWRALSKQKFYSLINVFGLAVGIAACLVIVLYIMDELSYDRYNGNAERTYRINTEIKYGGNHFNMTYTAAPLGQTLQQLYPEIESSVRFYQPGHALVRADGSSQNLKEQNVVWTDSTIFQVFSIKILEGDPNSALTKPGSIAMSKRTADKYFPGQSAVGKSVIINDKYHTTVTAVYEDFPSASHVHFNIMMSMRGDWRADYDANNTSFQFENFITYILLKPGTEPSRIESQFPKFLEIYLEPALKKVLGPDFKMSKYIAAGNKYELSLIPLPDIHLYSNRTGEIEANSDITYVYILGIIAGIILLIASINFMNLSTARSGNRSKEVGVRKVMGSLRGQLIGQFLTEAMIITACSIVTAVVLSMLILPYFNDVSQKQLQMPFGQLMFYVWLLAACLIIGMLAGFYPSFILSAFKPVNALKGKFAEQFKSRTVRSGLVVFQFFISIFLIVGAISVNKQLDYIQTKKLGFEKDQIVILHDVYTIKNPEIFKAEALKFDAIEAGTVSGYIPIESDWAWRSNRSYWKAGADPSIDNMIQFQQWYVDLDYIKTYQMKITAGRDFSADFPSDSSAVILNEAAVKRFGFKDPIGQRIASFGDDGSDGVSKENTQEWTVVGVVDDFHFSNMRQDIKPLSLFLGKTSGSISFRFKAAATNDAIRDLEGLWKKFAPEMPFQYSFLDDDFSKMYVTEQRLSKIFVAFAALAIVIACLGLFALTAFTAQQRTREIGIRKVLGASVQSILVLLSRDFGKLILIAFVLAIPVTWYAVDWWLSGYSYKTNIGMTVYLYSGLLAFIIAIVTMSFQSLKAALTNPVTSLRSE